MPERVSHTIFIHFINLKLKLTCPVVLFSFRWTVAIPVRLTSRWAYYFYRRISIILRRWYSVSAESWKSYFAFFSFRDLSIFIVMPLICPVSIRLLISATLNMSCFFKIDSRLTWKEREILTLTLTCLWAAILTDHLSWIWKSYCPDNSALFRFRIALS